MAVQSSASRRVLSDLPTNSSLNYNVPSPKKGSRMLSYENSLAGLDLFQYQSPKKSSRAGVYADSTSQRDGEFGLRKRDLPFEDVSAKRRKSSYDESILYPTKIPLNDSFVAHDPSLPNTASRITIRHRAQAMRLRLRLANYKVETNQIEVPMSRLQVKTSPKMNTTLSFATSLSSPRRRTPLPSTVPNFKLQKSAPQASSPKLFCEIPKDSLITTSNQDLVAPLLPRQREGLLGVSEEIPTQDDSFGGKDLINSVVKQTAADSLLDLMRHNDFTRSF